MAITRTLTQQQWRLVVVMARRRCGGCVLLTVEDLSINSAGTRLAALFTEASATLDTRDARNNGISALGTYVIIYSISSNGSLSFDPSLNLFNLTYLPVKLMSGE